MVGLYAGTGAVLYSIVRLEALSGPTPDVSPAMQCARNCSLACPGSYPRRLYRSLTTLESALGKIRPRRASSGGARLC